MNNRRKYIVMRTATSMLPGREWAIEAVRACAGTSTIVCIFRFQPAVLLRGSHESGVRVEFPGKVQDSDVPNPRRRSKGCYLHSVIGVVRRLGRGSFRFRPSSRHPRNFQSRHETRRSTLLTAETTETACPVSTAHTLHTPIVDIMPFQV